MSRVEPATAEELARFLQECACRRESLSIGGNQSKRAMGGPVLPSDHILSTAKLNRVLAYEPRDLTISVEAGHSFAGLQQLLHQNGQMIALDPPFSANATIGGVVAANSSGPMRRGYGTARDLVIGMKFATLEGKLVQTGGMVVKNVAGLDMGKLMIGSFGTLAVVTSVNFRLHSVPEATESFLYSIPDLEEALRKRDAILTSVLQPIAVDLLSPAFALRFSRRGHLLAIRAGGSRAVLARYRRELADAEPLEGEAEQEFWQQVQEMPGTYLHEQPDGVIVRVSSTLQGILELPKTVAGAFISRAANGITYFYFPAWTSAASWWRKVDEQQLHAVIEYGTHEVRSQEKLWLMPESAPGKNAFAMMEAVKRMFDPDSLLNRRRLYGRI